MNIEEDEDICGFDYDHVEHLTYEDADVKQWECERCGAEWYEDKEDEASA